MAGESFASDLKDVLNEIDLGCLDKKQADAHWDDDFVNVALFLQTFDEEFFPPNKNNFDSLLEKMHHILNHVARESRWDGFWLTFQAESIDPSRLSTFLCYFIARGFSRLPGLKLQTLKAVECYWLLISAPERSVYRISSCTTFERSVGILKRALAMLSSMGERLVAGGKRKKPRNENAGRKKKRKNKKFDVVEAFGSQNSNNNNIGGDDDDDDDGVGRGDDSDVQLNQEELKLEVVTALKDLCLLSGSRNLDESLVDAVAEVAVEMVSTETIATACGTDVYSKHGLDNICHLSHEILFQLVQSDQSRTSGKPHLFSKICHKLLPNVTLCRQEGQNIPQSAVVVRDNTVAFIRFVVERFGDEAEKVVKNFTKHVCTSAVDRSEHRMKTSQALLKLLSSVSSKTFCESVDWFIDKLAKSSKVPHRMIAVDMITMLLEGEYHLIVSGEEEQTSLQRELVRTLVDRCSDVSPSVRAKAIDSLATFTSLPSDGTVSMETTRRHGNNNNTTTSNNTTNVCSRSQVHRNASRLESSSMMQFCTQMSMLGIFNSTTCNGTIDLSDSSGVLSDVMMSMLRRRCFDKKAAVRKASVISLTNFIVLEGLTGFNKENLDSVSERCNDTSTMVRKQALQSLTDILRHVPDKRVQREWLQRLLHCSVYEDGNIQTKALELLEGILIDGLSSGCRDVDVGVAWDLLEVLTEQENYDLRKFFSKACKVWHKKNLLGGVTVDRISKLIGGKRSEAAWFLLSEFAGSSKDSFLLRRIKATWKEAAEDFERRVSTATGLEEGDLEGSVWGSMLKVMVGSRGEEELVSLVLDHIFECLNDFRHRVNDVSFLVVVLVAASKMSEDLKGKVETGFDGLFRVCREFVGRKLQVERTGDGDDDERLKRCIFTYGEVAQVEEGKRIDESSFHLLVQFIADESSSSSSSSSSVPKTSRFNGSRCSSDVRAFVFLSLGKFCLSSCEFAKLCLPALTRELKTSGDPRLRNNIIFVLCDLVTKYAVIVDPYVASVSAHLRDECPLVRKQTCLLLTRLLQEDFVKWKGCCCKLFFRFARGVVDENQHVRESFIFTMKHVHNKRHEDLFLQHFVETIFYFNDRTNFASFDRSQERSNEDREDAAFHLVGDQNQEKRMDVYKFLLESMTDGQRFQITGRLLNEVLTSFIDEAVQQQQLDEGSVNVLGDVLRCLCCQEIRLSVLKQQQQQHYEDDNEDATGQHSTTAENAAKKKFITQVTRRTIVEAAIPVALALKVLLEKHRSPVLKELMSYFAVLKKDYKQEVRAIVEMDPSLERELEFDLRRSEVTEGNQTQTAKALSQQNKHPSKTSISLNCPNTSHNNRRTSQVAMATIEAAKRARNQRLAVNRSVD